MPNQDLRDRTKRFALQVIQLCEAVPGGRTADIITRQLIRSGTSVGANYRAAKRAKSTSDFIAKMGIVEEECDECMYWMELLVEARLIDDDAVQNLMDEANPLVAITVSSIKTARSSL